MVGNLDSASGTAKVAPLPEELFGEPQAGRAAGPNGWQLRAGFQSDWVRRGTDGDGNFLGSDDDDDLSNLGLEDDEYEDDDWDDDDL